MQERLARVGDGRRTTREELEALAAYAEEVSSWASELGAKFADFEANVEMLGDSDTPRHERADLRRRMTEDAEAAAGALAAIGAWLQ